MMESEKFKKNNMLHLKTLLNKQKIDLAHSCHNQGKIHAALTLNRKIIVIYNLMWLVGLGV